MLIDLHIHEKTYSHDSKLSLEEIVLAAKQKGLDAVCITDHDDLSIAPKANAYAQEIGFPIFVGVEYYSLQGDLVTFGVDTIPNHRIDAQSYINFINQSGGVCFSAHPFRNNQRGLAENLLTIKGLAGIEVLNANTIDEENEKAALYCRKLQMQALGASDAHFAERVGHFASWFPQQIHSTDELVAALKARLGKAVFWTVEGYQFLSETNKPL